MIHLAIRTLTSIVTIPLGTFSVKPVGPFGVPVAGVPYHAWQRAATWLLLMEANPDDGPAAFTTGPFVIASLFSEEAGHKILTRIWSQVSGSESHIHDRTICVGIEDLMSVDREARMALIEANARLNQERTRAIDLGGDKDESPAAVAPITDGIPMVSYHDWHRQQYTKATAEDALFDGTGPMTGSRVYAGDAPPAGARGRRLGTVSMGSARAMESPGRAINDFVGVTAIGAGGGMPNANEDVFVGGGGAGDGGMGGGASGGSNGFASLGGGGFVHRGRLR